MDGSPGPEAGLGVGVSVEKPNPGVFTVDKRKGLERGSGFSHQLLWLEASGKVLGHLGQVLFGDRKDPKWVAVCTPIGWRPRATHQALLLADSKLSIPRTQRPRSRAGGECGVGNGSPGFSNPRHPSTAPSLLGKQTGHLGVTLSPGSELPHIWSPSCQPSMEAVNSSPAACLVPTTGEEPRGAAAVCSGLSGPQAGAWDLEGDCEGAESVFHLPLW